MAKREISPNYQPHSNPEATLVVLSGTEAEALFRAAANQATDSSRGHSPSEVARVGLRPSAA